MLDTRNLEEYDPEVQESLLDKDYITWRGLDWPAEAPEHQRHLTLWKKWKEKPYCDANFLNPISEHFFEACKMLFTPRQLIIHPWLEQMAEEYTMNEGLIMWGSAASGKSHGMGLLSLMDYITDPLNTFIMMASTTKPMLELRTFASVVENLNYLRSNARMEVPFKYVRQSMTVCTDSTNDSDLATIKSIIRGVAINEGSQKDARAAVMGVHLKYVRIVADELAAMRPAIIDVKNNLGVCEDFKFMAAANPESYFDLCGINSIPVGGWSAIDEDSTRWKTDSGWTVLRFNGYDSPGIRDPEKFYFLHTQKTIDRIHRENNNNLDAPAVWTFIKAMPPPQGLERTVLSEAMVKSYRMQDSGVVWKTAPVKVAGFDPAFTSDGDKPIVATAEVGVDIEGATLIQFGPSFQLKIEASSKVPVLEQLTLQVKDILTQETISVNRLGIDDSGTQSCADGVEMLMGRGVYRCNFSTKPPDLSVSSANSDSSVLRYRNRVTWMYFLALEYGQQMQIRGLSDIVASQLCTRRILPKSSPFQLESKSDYKKRTHSQSPDEADASMIILGLVRERLGLMPGTTEWNPSGVVLPTGQPGAGFSMDLIKKYNNLHTSY